MDPDAVLHVVLDAEKGVMNFTIGNAISTRMREIVVECLQHCLPAEYARYKAIKHPPSGATLLSRRQAYTYALGVFSAFVMKHYVRVA